MEVNIFMLCKNAIALKVGEEDEDLRGLARFSFQRAAQNGRKDYQLVTTYFFYQVILYSFQMVFSRMIYFKSFYKVEFEKTGHLIDLPHSPVCTSARWSYIQGVFLTGTPLKS